MAHLMLAQEEHEWGSCPSSPSWFGCSVDRWLHPSVLPCTLPCYRWCAGAHSTHNFSITCLRGLVGGPVPSLLHAVESLLQRQDESFSMDISSGTCHSDIWVLLNPSRLCPPLAPLRYHEELFFLLHRWRATDCRERSPPIWGTSFELT